MLAAGWDAHQHFWKLSRGDYPWPTREERVLYRDFSPRDLAPALADAGVGHTVVVQAAPTVEETRWLLAVAEATDYVAGVVGWVDLTAGDAPKTLDALRSSPYLVGIRPMLQDLPDPRWITQPEVKTNLQYCAEVGVCVDWLVTPRELPWVAEVAMSLPTLRYVVDHMGKPSAVTEDWASSMQVLAAHPGGHCKISGLSTWPPVPSPPDVGWKQEAVARVWDWFGPERLMFGSDWPVCLSGGITYREAVDVVHRLLPSQDPDAWDAVFRRNAARFYAPANEQ